MMLVDMPSMMLAGIRALLRSRQGEWLLVLVDMPSMTLV